MTAKITRLNVANFKRIHEVAVDIDGKHLVVGGDNTMGKSSLLDSIEALLSGGTKIPADPVHHGEDAATIRVELDNGIVIERTISKDRKSKVKISGGSGSGGKAMTAQRWLDAHLNANTLDPLAILSLSPKDKARMLRELVGLDTSEIDAIYSEAFESRTEAKRELRAAEAELQAHPAPSVEVPAKPLDSGELSEKLQAAIAKNSAREATQRELEQLRAEVRDDIDRANRLQKQLESLLSGIERSKERGKELAAKLSTWEPIDLAPIQGALASISETNANIFRARLHLDIRKKVEEKQQAVDALETLVKDAEDKRREMLASAKWPLPGLSVEDGSVTFNGVPLEQASQAEQLRVVVALAAASKPDIGVVLVRDGSRLDSKSLKLLLEEVTSAGLQAIVERVGDGDSGAVIIEDGRIRGK